MRHLAHVARTRRERIAPAKGGHMHPGFIPFWKARHCGERYTAYVGAWGSPRGSWQRESRWGYEASEEESGASAFGGGSFGVRRPLRFLAHKLELDENQVAELARILDELKTERAQAAVDHRRTVAAFAEAFSGDPFDDSKASEGAKLRLQSAERLRDAVLTALRRIHKILQPEQRARFAYLIRTGTLSL
ncbi:MAG TPA: Spy/CpxP family protein refolding chaperone [Thermoanaerobaculia bacterium]